jgi:hypothetical protein
MEPGAFLEWSRKSKPPGGKSSAVMPCGRQTVKFEIAKQESRRRFILRFRT